MRENGSIQFVGAVLAGLLACPCAFALNPTYEVTQYAHKSWTVSDGYFKGSLNAIAQMLDGYLGLGTDFGLLRFDGVRFVHRTAPAGEPQRTRRAGGRETFGLEPGGFRHRDRAGDSGKSRKHERRSTGGKDRRPYRKRHGVRV